MAQVFTDFSGCAAKPAPSLESFYEGQLDPDLHPDVRRRLAGWRTDAHRAARVREREHQAQLDYEGHNDEVEDWASRGCQLSALRCCFQSVVLLPRSGCGAGAGASHEACLGRRASSRSAPASASRAVGR